MKYVLKTSICLLAIVNLIAITTGCDNEESERAVTGWTGWRGPQGTGVSEESGLDIDSLAGGAEVLWSHNLSIGYSNVAVQGERVFAVGRTKGSPNKLAVWCLDAATGHVAWEKTFDHNGLPYSSPTLADGLLLVAAPDGTILCLRARDGKRLWQHNVESEFEALRPGHGWSSSPVVVGDVVLVAANTRGFAFELRSGRRLWEVADARVTPSRHPDENSYASPVAGEIGGTDCAVFPLRDALHGVDIGTGKEAWTVAYDVPGVTFDPVIAGGRVYLTEKARLFAIENGTPRELWSSSTRFSSFSTPVLLDGCLYGSEWPADFIPLSAAWRYFQTRRFDLLCVRAETGDVNWRHETGYVTVTAVGSTLLALELDGSLHVAEVGPDGYREIALVNVMPDTSRNRIFAVPPVYSGGRIYCRSYTGELVCIDAGGG